MSGLRSRRQRSNLSSRMLLRKLKAAEEADGLEEVAFQPELRAEEPRVVKRGSVVEQTSEAVDLNIRT